MVTQASRGAEAPPYGPRPPGVTIAVCLSIQVHAYEYPRQPPAQHRSTARAQPVAADQLVRRGAVLKEWTGLPPSVGTRVLDAQLDEPLRKGEWVVAVARGSKPMTYLHRGGALPFGFTNPIWVN